MSMWSGRCSHRSCRGRRHWRQIIATRVHLAAKDSGRYTYGNEIPERARTLVLSPLLMKPSTFTSERTFVALVACPERLRVCSASPELTKSSPLVSPTSTPICTPTSPVLVPSFTPNKVTVILCALVTSVRLTVTVVVPLPPLLLTDPVPAVTDALVNVRRCA